MSLTRRWEMVKQEAIRLADLGLAPKDIATRIDVDRATVQRWMAAGKLKDTRQAKSPPASDGPPVTVLVKPSEWAALVRREYKLDATDEQLVTMAEQHLGHSLDPLLPVSVRVSATRAFQGLVKQLNLVARAADVAPAAKPEPKTQLRVVPRRAAGDPRRVLDA